MLSLDKSSLNGLDSIVNILISYLNKVFLNSSISALNMRNCLSMSALMHRVNENNFRVEYYKAIYIVFQIYIEEAEVDCQLA